MFEGNGTHIKFQRNRVLSFSGVLIGPMYIFCLGIPGIDIKANCFKGIFMPIKF